MAPNKPVISHSRNLGMDPIFNFPPRIYILTLTMKTSSLLPIANTYNHLCSHVIFQNFSSLNQCRGRSLKYIGGILIEAPQQVKIP